MAGAEAVAQFKDAMVFLAAAGIGVPLLQRLKVNPILGFMLAGMAFGPYGLGQFAAQYPWLGWVTINDAASFEGLGEVGVIFLLFTIGLDVSFARLWTLRRLLFGLGPAQVPASAIVLGGALAAGRTGIGVVGLEEFDDLVADAHQRVEGRQRLLKDHGDLAALPFPRRRSWSSCW